MKSFFPLGQAPLYPHQRRAFDSLVAHGGQMIVEDAIDGRRMTVMRAVSRAGYCKRKRIDDGSDDDRAVFLFWI